MLGRILLCDGVVDLAAARVWRVDRIARLTGAEVDVLARLARVPREVVDRYELLETSLGHSSASTSRAVDMVVLRLRGKIERDPSRPVHLLTAHGEGYRLVPASVIDRPRTNVPLPRTTLVGRDRETAQVQSALPTGPMVLVGPAGAGKTHLAAALALDAARTWAPAGVWWVDLSELREDLPPAVAAAAGIDAVDAETVASRLANRGPTLVVLDTCDRCVDRAGAFVAVLAPRVTVLLTSRVPVPGVRSLEVGPLSPEDAVRLLLDRARAAGVDHPLEPEWVARLAEAAERLPLSLELAAARLPALPPAWLEGALTRPLRLLRGGSGTGRQASVQVSIQWSWDALTPADRRGLTRLAVVRGPIGDPTARALLGDDPGCVGRLGSVHLLRPVDGGQAPWHAVREFAETHGDAEVLRAARADHAAWFTTWAAARAAALWGPGYDEALTDLERHEADLLVAHGAEADPVATAMALGELDHERGGYLRAAERIEAVVARFPDDPRTPALLALASSCAGRLGRWDHAREVARRALVSGPDAVEALAALAIALARCGRRAEAVGAAERAVEVAGDRPVLRVRAHGAWNLARFGDAVGESLPIARRALDWAIEDQVVRVIPFAAHNLAAQSMRAGELALGERVITDAIGRMGRRRRGIAIAYQNLSMVTLATDPERSLTWAGLALEAFRDMGAEDGQRVMLGVSGALRAVIGGDPIDALAEVDEATADAPADPRGAQLRTIRAAVLSHLGRRGAADAAWAEVRPQLGSLGLDPADAAALEAAWTGSAALDPGFVARVGRMPGSRPWVHLQLLRWARR